MYSGDIPSHVLRSGPSFHVRGAVWTPSPPDLRGTLTHGSPWSRPWYVTVPGHGCTVVLDIKEA